MKEDALPFKTGADIADGRPGGKTPSIMTLYLFDLFVKEKSVYWVK